MPTRKTQMTFPEAYQEAWGACRDLWPLFLARVIYMILNFGTLLFCLFLTFWPILEKFFQQVQPGNLGSFNYQSWASDFAMKAQDLNWVILTLGVFLLYLTWWTILAAWFNGGLYGRLWAWAGGERKFSWMDFLKDGLYHLIPMVLLQSFLGIALMIALFIGFMVCLIGGVFLTMIHLPFLLIVLSALPLPFLLVLFLVFFCVDLLLSQGLLLREMTPWAAFQEGIRLCLENKGRLFRGMGFLLGVVFVVAVLAHLVLAVFSLIPLLGLFFMLADSLLGILVSVWFWIYFPALAVVFLAEKES